MNRYAEKELEEARRDHAIAARRFNEASSALLHAELEFNRTIERLAMAEANMDANP